VGPLLEPFETSTTSRGTGSHGKQKRAPLLSWSEFQSYLPCVWRGMVLKMVAVPACKPRAEESVRTDALEISF
jgi:hypothetical protein